MLAPEATKSRLRALAHLGLIAALLLAMLAIVTGRPTGTNAQSATPAAGLACEESPLAEAPIVPDTLADSTPAATPEAVVAADESTAAAIGGVIDTLAVCLTAGNAEVVATLVTDRYLADAYGGGERMTKEDYVALAQFAPVFPVSVVSVGQIDLVSRDSATAQVVTIYGNQLRTEEWTFLFRRNRQSSATPEAVGGVGHWLVHQVLPLASTPPDGATQADAVQQTGSITVTPGTIEGPDIVFTVRSADDATHEFLVLRLVDGATIDELIRPTSAVFPTNMEFIGQETIPAGETRTLVLVGLEPGEYTVVCLLPEADGVPHLALGETTTFTVS